MPCYSVTTATQMTDADRLAAALVAAGHKIATKTATLIETEASAFGAGGLTFTRSGANAFTYQGSPTKTLADIGRHYAELTARVWAKRNGLNVRRADEKGMTLVSTRS